MWPKPQIPADLVTFTEEILNGKLQFLCSAKSNGTERYDGKIELKDKAFNISRNDCLNTKKTEVAKCLNAYLPLFKK